MRQVGHVAFDVAAVDRVAERPPDCHVHSANRLGRVVATLHVPVDDVQVLRRQRAQLDRAHGRDDVCRQAHAVARQGGGPGPVPVEPTTQEASNRLIPSLTVGEHVQVACRQQLSLRRFRFSLRPEPSTTNTSTLTSCRIRRSIDPEPPASFTASRRVLEHAHDRDLRHACDETCRCSGNLWMSACQHPLARSCNPERLERGRGHRDWHPGAAPPGPAARRCRCDLTGRLHHPSGPPRARERSRNTSTAPRAHRRRSRPTRRRTASVRWLSDHPAPRTARRSVP